MTSYDAVLFISFGGPEKREDIRPFLDIVTRGRRIPPQRIDEVVHHYEAIGGASPINAITRRQAEGLRALLAASDAPRPVYLGQRNWHPFLVDTLRRMAADGIQRAIGFITAGHRCEASLERYLNAVEKGRAEVGASAPAIDTVGPWFDHRLFIDAIAARIQDALPMRLSMEEHIPWIFVAHSIPCAMAKASTYVPELRRTAELVCQKFGRRDYRLAYCSRSGSPGDPWLEPDVGDEIRAQAKRAVQEVVMIPIGFVADHVEVLYDLDIEARHVADSVGVRLTRVPTVGDHPLFLEMMAEVVRRGPPGAAELACSSAVSQDRDGHRMIAVGAAALECYCHPGASQPPCRQREAMVSPPSSSKSS